MGALDLFPTSGEHFVRYRGTAVVTNKIVGGVPKDRDTIRKWLESRVAQGADLALQEVINETTEAMEEGASFGDLMDEVTKKLEGGNGFKTVDGQLCWEGRCLKAGLKEAANVVFPGTDFPGKPKGMRKGLMRYMAERVFVEEIYIPLGVSEATGTDQTIKHLRTPQGPRSAIGVADYVEQPKISFTIAVLDDCITPEVWGRVWQALEQIGIGAERSQSAGRFELLEWERLN